MLLHHPAPWSTSNAPSWPGILPARWAVWGSLMPPTLGLLCRAGLIASALLWRCPGGQEHLVSCNCASLQVLSFPYSTITSHVTAGNVPTYVHAAMKQATNTQPIKLEQHLSASQYTQRLVSTVGMKQLRLCGGSPMHRPTVAAFCVDHQLRPESSQECQQAAKQASGMGLQSHVIQMQWPQLPATGHIMEQASITRYQLLHRMCKASNISVLLTGHHAGMCPAVNRSTGCNLARKIASY